MVEGRGFDFNFGRMTEAAKIKGEIKPQTEKQPEKPPDLGKMLKATKREGRPQNAEPAAKKLEAIKQSDKSRFGQKAIKAALESTPQKHPEPEPISTPKLEKSAPQKTSPEKPRPEKHTAETAKTIPDLRKMLGGAKIETTEPEARTRERVKSEPYPVKILNTWEDDSLPKTFEATAWKVQYKGNDRKTSYPIFEGIEFIIPQNKIPGELKLGDELEVAKHIDENSDASYDGDGIVQVTNFTTGKRADIKTWQEQREIEAIRDKLGINNTKREPLSRPTVSTSRTKSGTINQPREEKRPNI